MSDEPKLAHRCGMMERKLTSFKWLGNQHRRRIPTARVVSPSTAAQKYTPAAPFISKPGNCILPSSRDCSSGTTPVPHQPSSPPIPTHAQSGTPNSGNLVTTWILFGVKGSRRGLELTEVPINSQTTDYSAFQALKSCYQAHRGRLKLWFSIWRLDNCEVVKVQISTDLLHEGANCGQFNKFTEERLVREHKDLPAHQEYQYTPRAGSTNARNPPISRHEFGALVHSCPLPCTRLIPHDCMTPPKGDIFLERVPKRAKCFKGDQASPIWGFEAVFAVSFRYVCIYHCAMVAGPLIFWLLWLEDHPDDLQNAAIPLTVVIGALSLFWSSAGILTSTIEG